MYHGAANCFLVAGPRPFKIDVVNLNMAGWATRLGMEIRLPTLLFQVEVITEDLLNPAATLNEKELQDLSMKSL